MLIAYVVEGIRNWRVVLLWATGLVAFGLSWLGIQRLPLPENAIETIAGVATAVAFGIYAVLMWFGMSFLAAR